MNVSISVGSSVCPFTGAQRCFLVSCLLPPLLLLRDLFCSLLPLAPAGGEKVCILKLDVKKPGECAEPVKELQSLLVYTLSLYFNDQAAD